MSDPLEIGFNLGSAVGFNRRHGVRLWGHIQLQSDWVNDHPGLALPPGEEGFALATHDLQKDIFSDEIEFDGKFGLGTWAAALDHYQGGWATDQDDPPQRIIRSGVSASVECETKILTWEDDDGLNLHVDGGWARRSEQPNCIVLHWGGRNARSCRNALASRDLSSHFGVDRSIIYQWLDLGHSAWHAGSRANTRSIGVDICQQPTVNLAQWYEARGYDLDVVANPSSRGADEILTLHPEIVKATADLLRVLNRALGIPLAFPRDDKVLSPPALSRFRGVLGHHHISKRKWDVAPWLPAIKEELEV